MLQWRYVLETLKMVSRKYCKVAKKNVAILILIPHSPFPLHSLFILPTIAWIPMSTPRPQPSHCPPDLDHVKLASSSPIPHAAFWLRPIDSQPWGCANYAKAGKVFALWHCLSRTPSSVNRAFFQNYFFTIVWIWKQQKRQKIEYICLEKQIFLWSWLQRFKITGFF